MNDILNVNIQKMLPIRAASSHKGTYGRLTCVVGSSHYRGAAALSTVSALRSGAGIVRLASVEPAIAVAAGMDPSMIFLPLEMTEGGSIGMHNWEEIVSASHDSKSMLIGSGIGQDNDTKILVKELVEKFEKTLILDADALNIISGLGVDILKKCMMTPIITPHIGEMASLTETTAEAVSENMEECAKTFSMAYSCITVLKSSKTVISDKTGEIFVLDSPNPALATAGSGDVLAGLIAGLSVQGISPTDSAILGVYIHSEAGKRAAKKYSTYSTTAKDILSEIPEVFLQLGR